MNAVIQYADALKRASFDSISIIFFDLALTLSFLGECRVWHFQICEKNFSLAKGLTGAAYGKNHFVDLDSSGYK